MLRSQIQELTSVHIDDFQIVFQLLYWLLIKEGQIYLF
jgi:hypothetical protein